MNKSISGILVFSAGAVVMIFEISGSRILGPYLGSSLFVWSGLIGVIMACLSAGYWAGGRLSIKYNRRVILGIVFFLITIFILFTLISNRFFLRNLVNLVHDKRAFTIIASILLFGPVSFLCGVILPLAIRTFALDIQSSGRKTGIIFALSSVGSIIGTVLAGFVLLPYFGHIRVLFITSFACAILALFVFIRFKSWRYFISSIIVFIICFTVSIWFINRKRSFIDVDTMYNRVIIYETIDQRTGKPVKMLMVNDEKSSAMFLDSDDLVFEVLDYYRLAEHFYPGFKKTMMIGGSGYAFPKFFLKEYPSASIDVVEIDEGLTDIAKKYFRLIENPRLNINHEDGRTFLNRNKKIYDVIYMDAYKSVITIPYQLTTKEAVNKMFNSLNDKGIVMANIISTRNNQTNWFLQAEYATYSTVFPYVSLFSVGKKKNPNHFQNFMLVAMKKQIDSINIHTDSILQNYLSYRVKDFVVSRDIEILTDEYAPVDFYSYTLLFKGQPK